MDYSWRRKVSGNEQGKSLINFTCEFLQLNLQLKAGQQSKPSSLLVWHCQHTEQEACLHDYSSYMDDQPCCFGQPPHKGCIVLKQTAGLKSWHTDWFIVINENLWFFFKKNPSDVSTWHMKLISTERALAHLDKYISRLGLHSTCYFKPETLLHAAHLFRREFMHPTTDL